MKKRLLMVGRSRYSLPLSPSLEQKFDALSAELDVRVLASSGGGRGTDPRFQLVRPIRPRALDGPAFYALAPVPRGARAARRSGPTPCSPRARRRRRSACSDARSRASRRRVIADIHGDPAAPARLYGSSWRKALAPLADALARRGLRTSDGVRTISAYTSGLVREAGVEPTAEFAAFMDLEPFVERDPVPLPERARRAVRRRPRALQGGRRARGRLAPRRPARPGRDAPPRRPRDAPRRAASGSSPISRHRRAGRSRCRRPRSRGRSTRRPFSCSRRARRVSGASSSRRSAADAAWSEAASAASRTSSRTARPGILVQPGDARRSPTRSCACSRDRALAERLGAAAHAAVQPWLATPEEYARRIRELVDDVTG